MRPNQGSKRTVTSFLVPFQLYFNGIEAGRCQTKITELDLNIYIELQAF